MHCQILAPSPKRNASCVADILETNAIMFIILFAISRARFHLAYLKMLFILDMVCTVTALVEASIGGIV